MGARRRGALESLRCARRGGLDSSYKAVAASRNGRNIPPAGLPLSQRFSKCRDVDFEIALFHDNVGPRASHELAFGDKLARTLDQCGQDLESATPETNESLAFQQALLCGKEPERAERKSALGRVCRLIVHSSLTSL